MSACTMTPKPDTWTVPPKFAGTSLQEYLAETLGISKRAAKQQIDARAVWVNDRCVWMAHHALKRGDVVRIPRRAPSPILRPAPLCLTCVDSRNLI